MLVYEWFVGYKMWWKQIQKVDLSMFVFHSAISSSDNCCTNVTLMMNSQKKISINNSKLKYIHGNLGEGGGEIWIILILIIVNENTRQI